MTMVRSGYLALIVLVPTLGSVLLGSTRCAAADPEFDKLVDDYFAGMNRKKVGDSI